MRTAERNWCGDTEIRMLMSPKFIYKTDGKGGMPSSAVTTHLDGFDIAVSQSPLLSASYFFLVI